MIKVLYVYINIWLYLSDTIETKSINSPEFIQMSERL